MAVGYFVFSFLLMYMYYLRSATLPGAIVLKKATIILVLKVCTNRRILFYYFLGSLAVQGICPSSGSVKVILELSSIKNLTYDIIKSIRLLATNYSVSVFYHKN